MSLRIQCLGGGRFGLVSWINDSAAVRVLEGASDEAAYCDKIAGYGTVSSRRGLRLHPIRPPGAAGCYIQKRDLPLPG